MSNGMIWKGTMAFIVVGLGALLFRPVCEPLGPQNLASFNVPAIKRMQERDLYLKIWQEKSGQWYQCKTYFTRHFSF